MANQQLTQAPKQLHLYLLVDNHQHLKFPIFLDVVHTKKQDNEVAKIKSPQKATLRKSVFLENNLK